MARRVPNPGFRTFAITLEGVPATLSEEMIKSLIEGAVKDTGTAVAVKAPPAPKKPKLIHRNKRKADSLVCTYTKTIGGITYNGCGRSFATRRGLELHLDHLAGTFADKARWPNHCLDSIVDPSLRDDR